MCVFKGFCCEGPCCRGSDGWGLVSEAFLINLPAVLFNRVVLIYSFLVTLTVNHIHTHTNTHILSVCHTSIDCNCMPIFIHSVLPHICTQNENNQPNNISCLTHAVIVITHCHLCTNRTFCLLYLFMHTPHTLIHNLFCTAQRLTVTVISSSSWLSEFLSFISF